MTASMPNNTSSPNTTPAKNSAAISHTNGLATRGIHHITTIASDPQKNHDFYTRVLGLRLVKTTVNFDDPGSYHLYFADHAGSPGTVLTFFPWPGAKRGRQGAGSVLATAFAVPVGALTYWADRLASLGIAAERSVRFGVSVLSFEDHDGTRLELVEDAAAPEGRAFLGGDVPAPNAIRGFHSATLLLRDAAATRELLTGMYGYRELAAEGARTRLVSTGAAGTDAGLVIDLVEDADAPWSRLGAGVVHHIALRASGDGEQRAWHAEARRRGLNVSPVMDRTYFRSIYMREPGGVLIEVATDGPGFAIDEPLEALGASLRLPPQYEPSRAAIEAHLPPLKR